LINLNDYDGNFLLNMHKVTQTRLIFGSTF